MKQYWIIGTPTSNKKMTTSNSEMFIVFPIKGRISILHIIQTIYNPISLLDKMLSLTKEKCKRGTANRRNTINRITAKCSGKYRIYNYLFF